ncbi:MAG: threonylcarbamoyl-AMP synthase [Candidatus Sumerlaeaceae bacterium]|nr:threonylcarbamoyl-AMP synthase [Candidatus Sumerlaeaceae bacterium]
MPAKVGILLARTAFKRDLESGLEFLNWAGVEFKLAAADPITDADGARSQIVNMEDWGAEALLVVEAFPASLAALTCGQTLLPLVYLPIISNSALVLQAGALLATQPDLSGIVTVGANQTINAMVHLLRVVSVHRPELREQIGKLRKLQATGTSQPPAVAPKPPSSANPRKEIVNPQDEETLQEIRQAFATHSPKPTAKPSTAESKPTPLRYTPPMQQVVATARDVAGAYGSVLLTPEHFLAAILETPESAAYAALKASKVNLKKFAKAILENFPEAERHAQQSEARVFDLAPSAKSVLDLARSIARSKQHGGLTTAHYLEAYLNSPESRAVQILKALKLKPDQVAKALAGPLPDELALLSPKPPAPEPPPEIHFDEAQIARLKERLTRRANPKRGKSGEHSVSQLQAWGETTPPTSVPKETAALHKGTPQILACDPLNPPLRIIESACDALLEGAIVAFPTEHGYSLGVDATNAAAVDQLRAIAGRSPAEPITILIYSTSQLRALAGGVPAVMENLLEDVWPGPLTLVVERPSRSFATLSPGGTLGIRLPVNYVALSLLSMLSRPIAAISARKKRGGKILRASDVAKAYPNGLSILLNGGDIPKAGQSTVFSIAEKPFKILRQGDLPKDKLKTALRSSGT